MVLSFVRWDIKVSECDGDRKRTRLSETAVPRTQQISPVPDSERLGSSNKSRSFLQGGGHRPARLSCLLVNQITASDPVSYPAIHTARCISSARSNATILVAILPHHRLILIVPPRIAKQPPPTHRRVPLTHAPDHTFAHQGPKPPHACDGVRRDKNGKEKHKRVIVSLKIDPKEPQKVDENH